MITLRVENVVRDYDSWKETFDKYEQFRADGGVRAYRVARSTEEPGKVTIDLDFDSPDQATSFRTGLAEVMSSPQAGQHLLSHQPPHVYDVLQRTL